MAEIRDWKEVPVDDWKEVPVGESPSIEPTSDIPSPGPVASTFLSMLKSLSEPRGMATTLGMVTGGTVGAGSGLLTGGTTSIPGAIVGAGLGGAGAGQAYDRLMEILGVKKKETPAEAATTALTEAGEFGLAEAIPQVGVPILNALINRMPWAKKGLTESAQKLFRIAKEENIKLPAAAITGDRSQMALTQTAGQMPVSQRTIEDEIAEAWKGIETQGNKVVKGKGLNVTPLQAGETAQTGQALKYQKLDEQGKALHQQFMDVGKDVPIEPKMAIREAEIISKMDDFKALPPEVKGVVQSIIDKTKGTPESARSFYRGTPTSMEVINAATPQQKMMGVVKEKAIMTPGQPFTNVSSPAQIPSSVPKTRPLSAIDELRKDIQSSAGFEKVHPEKGDALVRRIGKALDEDIFDSLKINNPEAYKAFRAEKDFYRNNIFGKFKGLDIYKQPAMGESIMKMDPSTVLKEANTVTGLKQLQEVMPENYFDIVRRGKIAELIDSSMMPIDTGTYGQLNVFDGYKLSKAIYRDMTPEYRAMLFKPGELDALDRVIATSESMKALQRYGGSQSGTPKGTFYGKMLTGTIPLETGSLGWLVGGPTGAVIGGSVGLLGPYGAAKLITSKAGKEYLINGVKLGEGTKQFIRAGGVTVLDFLKQKEQGKGAFPSK